MAHALCLQDWITITGATSARISQAQMNYVDVSAYADVCPYVEVARATGGPFVLDVLTAPARDQSVFTLMADSSLNVSRYTATGLNPLLIFRASDSVFGAVPPSRYLYWGCGGTPPWSLTFRIWLSANQSRSRPDGSASGALAATRG